MSTSVETSIRARVLMVGASVLFTLIAAEWLLFPLLLPWTPLRLHVYLDEGVRVLAQSSKASLAPDRWVALAGDSYAQGRGDWLLSQDPGRNGPFHSAHVLHDRSGIDVLSLGRGGTGALRGVVEAIAKEQYLARSMRFPLPPPERLLFYFYEGNDVHDTLLELSALYGGSDEPGEAGSQEASDPFRRATEHRGFHDDDDLRRRVALLVEEHPLVRRLERSRWIDEWYLGRFLGAVLAGEWAGRPPAASPEEDVFPLLRQRPTLASRPNRLRVGGREVKVAMELQGPGPELREEEIEAALWVFEQSLRALREDFASSRLCVVYLPSPATSYRAAAGTLTLQTLGRPPVFTEAAIQASSTALRARVAAIAERVGVDFLDVTPDVRARARREMLHGPTDMRHFNEAGYTVLGDALARHLEAARPGPAPGG